MVMISKSGMLVPSLIVLIGLTALAGYSLYQTRALSLPISTIFAFAATLLPLVTFISTQLIQPLLRDQATISRNALSIILMSIFPLIYETIIATLSITYMFPGCSLEDKWKQLYSNRDANAIRSIQDRFDCCGFNSVNDRAWPFPYGRPEDGHGSDQCKRTYGRARSCRGPWQQQEKINASLFFTVAIFIFVIKALVVIVRLRARSSSGWFSSFWVPFTSRRRDNYSGVQNYIEDGEQGQAVEPYIDDTDGGGGETNAANANHTRFTVQPSGLISDGSERWREDVHS